MQTPQETQDQDQENTCRGIDEVFNLRESEAMAGRRSNPRQESYCPTDPDFSTNRLDRERWMSRKWLKPACTSSRSDLIVGVRDEDLACIFAMFACCRKSGHRRPFRPRRIYRVCEFSAQHRKLGSGEANGHHTDLADAVAFGHGDLVQSGGPDDGPFPSPLGY